MIGALYRGAVMHRRHRPVGHAFRYRVFAMVLDLDRVGDAVGGLRLLSWNRFNLFSFHDRDHGARDGSALRPWVEQRLREAGVDGGDGPIRLLCFPRLLGYVFNPLSVYFCHRADGSLAAAVYEVKNTLDRPVTGQAVPSYTPAGAAQYFKKLECFCFQQQTLGPGEVRRMPVVFVVDPEIPSDVGTITLSYTFFEVAGKAHAAAPGGGGAS